MPILAAEPDLYPDDLLESAQPSADPDSSWWLMYCLPRQEKQLLRRLRALEISHYCPLIAKRNRSPNGRIRTSHIPLFPGYAFIFGGEPQRHAAISTGCVSRHDRVVDAVTLQRDLRQVHRLIESGVDLTPEAQLVAGDRVRIASGPFLGFEGTVLRREGETRLLVAVNYLEQGVSMLLEDCQLQEI